MLRGFLRISVLAGCFSLASLTATAQEVVNALVGTVRYINTAAKTITITTDDGSDTNFKVLLNSKISLEFDRSIRNDAIAANKFQKSGVRAIVYYFGIGDDQTVVALRSLGPGPFIISTGSVVEFDAKEHLLSIKDQTGTVKDFKITSDTVAETNYGATAGLNYQPHKGDQIRINAVDEDGDTTALFINTLVAN